MRWHHCLAHTDNIQTLAKSPDCLLGIVMQLTDSRLSETIALSTDQPTRHFYELISVWMGTNVSATCT